MNQSIHSILLTMLLMITGVVMAADPVVLDRSKPIQVDLWCAPTDQAGRQMGLKHGAYHRFSVPCANLFVTMLDRLGTPVGRFADSTGGLPQLI